MSMERGDAQIPTTKNIEGQMVSVGDPMEPSMNAKPKTKRKNKSKRKKKQTPPENCVGDQSLAWKVESQMKITQQNKCLEGAVNKNADSELQKFKRHIREDKYIARKYTNPKNWSFYRALIWIFEDKSSESLSSIAILEKAKRQAKEMNEDYYAFNGLPKDKVERARNFQRRNWPRINVDNKDWEIIINTKDPSQDPDLKK